MQAAFQFLFCYRLKACDLFVAYLWQHLLVLDETDQQEETVFFNKTGKTGKYYDFSAVPVLSTIVTKRKVCVFAFTCFRTHPTGQFIRGGKLY